MRVTIAIEKSETGAAITDVILQKKRDTNATVEIGGVAVAGVIQAPPTTHTSASVKKKDIGVRAVVIPLRTEAVGPDGLLEIVHGERS